MRSLTKLPVPAILLLHGAEWTREYLAASSTKERKKLERWRHPEIQSSLREETNSKCAYCEGLIEDVAYAHVEHIVPKVARRELAHEWSNMTRACPVCNIKKDDYYVVGNELLNPYVDDVEARLSFFGDFVDWTAGDDRAELTVHRLQLNRYELLKSRCSRLASNRQLLERWFHAAEPQKSVLADAIKTDAEQGEFSATVEAFLRARGFFTA